MSYGTLDSDEQLSFATCLMYQTVKHTMIQ